MINEKICVLLADGTDKQTLPLAHAFKKLGCYVATLNSSKLDNGYSTRFSDEKLLDRSILNNKQKQIKVIFELSKSGKYDIIVTTSDDTAEFLSLHKEELEKSVKSVAVVEPELFYKAYDKAETMRICMENNLPCPKTFIGISTIDQIPADDLSFPIVVKPRKSFGAIGFRRLDDRSSLIDYCSSLGENLKDYIIQEYIPQSDIQYDCVMFMDQKSIAKTACVLSKNRWFPVKGGSSTCNVTVDRPDIVENCRKLLEIIQWRGPADIDLIQDPRDGIAKIIEINPRVSANIKIVLKAGVNIAQQILQLALGEEVTSYREYVKDMRLRCIHTDLLWFIKSPNRFRSKPSWFSWQNTFDQIWSWDDPIPFLTFSLQALVRYKKEMQKRS